MSGIGPHPGGVRFCSWVRLVLVARFFGSCVLLHSRFVCRVGMACIVSLLLPLRVVVLFVWVSGGLRRLSVASRG